MRVRVYVDGFNLYYGALKDSQAKWLDIDAWSRRMMGQPTIDFISYFTARVTARSSDPDASTRQDVYLRALSTLPNVGIFEGQFKLQSKTMPRDRSKYPACCVNKPKCPCSCCSNPYAHVLRTEEKGSDVNLAVHLVGDGYKNLYDVAMVVSEDSDLQPAIDLVRHDLGKHVVVVTPRNLQHMPLLGDEKRTTRRSALLACQFPASLTDEDGRTISRPPSW